MWAFVDMILGMILAFNGELSDEDKRFEMITKGLIYLSIRKSCEDTSKRVYILQLIK